MENTVRNENQITKLRAVYGKCHKCGSYCNAECLFPTPEGLELKRQAAEREFTTAELTRMIAEAEQVSPVRVVEYTNRETAYGRTSRLSFSIAVF